MTGPQHGGDPGKGRDPKPLQGNETSASVSKQPAGRAANHENGRPTASGLPWAPGTIAPMTAEGMMAMRGKRRSIFLGRILPYMPYIIQSGLAVSVLLLLILFSAWYTSILQDMPPGFPIQWILPILIFPLAAWSSFRTYLQSADTVFLLPLETQMKAYFAPAWRAGVIGKLLLIWVVLLVAWPIYIRVLPGDHANLWASLLLLLGLKLLFAYGAWQEHRMVSARQADVHRLLRWVLAAASVFAWFWLPLFWSVIAIVVLAALYALVLRFPPKHRVPWERLIAVEKAQAGRAMRMLGWFVDVPTQDPRVYRRRLLSGVGRSIPWKPEEAYRFLLTRSFIRGDMLGMAARLAVVGFVLQLLARESWLGVALLLLFTFMIGMQLNGLRRTHADSLWLGLYPIPEDSRVRAGLYLMIRVLLIASAFMWLPFLLTLPSDPLLAVGALAAAWVLCFLLHHSAGRKWRKLEGEDE